jgi:hypothetical protein
MIVELLIRLCVECLNDGEGVKILFFKHTNIKETYLLYSYK